MKAIAISAPQSRNLTNNLFREVTKMIKKQLYRTNRMHVALRAWSRNTTAKYGNILLWVMSIAAIGCFVSAIFENDPLTAIFAIVGMAAMTPEMTMKTYEPMEDEIC